MIKFDFENKNVIVTGASMGLGKAIAFASYKTLYNSGYQNEMITINQGRALAIIKIEDRECFEYELLFTN